MVCTAIALALTLAACAKDGGGDKPPERGDVAVAKVDGKAVWLSDVKREAIAQGRIGAGEPFDATNELFPQMLDEVIDQKLLAAEAQKRGVGKDALGQRRLAAARDRLLGDMLIESVVADAVTENNIRGLYEEQQKNIKRADEIKARRIVVPNQAEAEAIRKQLAGGARFEALAMEKSTDASTRFSGGDLGYFTVDVMPEAYATALAEAKPGQLIGPFQVEGGWAVVKVEDRRLEPAITLDAARPQIVRFLTYDRVRDLLEKLRAKAKVEPLVKPTEGGAKPVPPADAPKAVPVAPGKGAKT
jgi:peptidyl-prolyl cis-trans isomerase C